MPRPTRATARAAGFTYLACQVGFDAQLIPGTGVSPKGSESVHAWTEITIDGTAYTFDPQIEKRVRSATTRITTIHEEVRRGCLGL